MEKIHQLISTKDASVVLENKITRVLDFVVKFLLHKSSVGIITMSFQEIPSGKVYQRRKGNLQHRRFRHEAGKNLPGMKNKLAVA